MSLKKRLAALEANAAETESGIEFFRVEGDLYVNTHSGRRYTRDEYLAAARARPGVVFIPIAEPVSPFPELDELTVEELRSGAYDEQLRASWAWEEEQAERMEPVIRDIRRRLGLRYE